MKSALTLPIVSGIALAIMAGAAASHYHSVGNLVAFAGMTRANGMPSTNNGPVRFVSNEMENLSIVEQLEREKDSLEQTLAENKNAISAMPQQASAPRHYGNESDTQSLLAEVRYLRNQVSETNRDMMTLQFQVDSHSTQFRPLNLAENPSEPRAIDSNPFQNDLIAEPFENDSIGLLPPNDLP